MRPYRADRPPEDIYERPATRFVADFVGSAESAAATGTGDGRHGRAEPAAGHIVAHGRAPPAEITFSIRTVHLNLSAAKARLRLAGAVERARVLQGDFTQTIVLWATSA